MRTQPHGFGNLPPREHAPAPPVAVLARARQLPCATRPNVWQPCTPPEGSDQRHSPQILIKPIQKIYGRMCW
jgi:hypothetical protein